MLLARLLFVAATLTCAVETQGADAARLETGKGQYRFPHAGAGVEVYYFKPSTVSAATPVWFVMHGTNRNADDYRDNWVELGEKHQALVIVPQFSKDDFPRYHLGEVVDKKGELRPREKTVFRIVEQIFSDVVAREGLSCERYCMFGHSAGGQFVHRMVLLEPEHRMALAVAANSGWYTVPVPTRKFPYGLAGTACNEKELARSFGAPLCVLLGDADTDPMHPLLNRSEGANEQGPHRLARGRHFFETAKGEAERLQVPFRWTLQTVPGVAHSNGQMAPAAAELMARALPDAAGARSGSKPAD